MARIAENAFSLDDPAEDEELGKEQAENIRTFRRQLIQRVCDALEEFICEAELQDGYDYWLKFKDVKAAAVDFGTYLSNGGAEDYEPTKG